VAEGIKKPAEAGFKFSNETYYFFFLGSFFGAGAGAGAGSTGMLMGISNIFSSTTGV
jgi:hypothetical protein